MAISLNTLDDAELYKQTKILLGKVARGHPMARAITINELLTRYPTEPVPRLEQAVDKAIAEE